MAVPQTIIDDVRNFRCVGLIDGGKSARESVFGLLREPMVFAGRIFAFIKASESQLRNLGFKRAEGMKEAVWYVDVEHASDLDNLYSVLRRLPCSATAIIVGRGQIGELVSKFSSAAVVANAGVGFGRRAQQFERVIARRLEAALLTFDARDDVYRLYYHDAIVEDVVRAFERSRIVDAHDLGSVLPTTSS